MIFKSSKFHSLAYIDSEITYFGANMKIVVVKSPKLFVPILRKLFKISKVNK